MRQLPWPCLPFVSGKGKAYILLTFVMLVHASLPLTPLGLA